MNIKAKITLISCVIIFVNGCSTKIDKCVRKGPPKVYSSGQKCVSYNKSGACERYENYKNTYRPCEKYVCIYGGNWPKCNKKSSKADAINNTEITSKADIENEDTKRYEQTIQRSKEAMKSVETYEKAMKSMETCINGTNIGNCINVYTDHTKAVKQLSKYKSDTNAFGIKELNSKLAEAEHIMMKHRTIQLCIYGGNWPKCNKKSSKADAINNTDITSKADIENVDTKRHVQTIQRSKEAMKSVETYEKAMKSMETCINGTNIGNCINVYTDHTKAVKQLSKYKSDNNAFGIKELNSKLAEAEHIMMKHRIIQLEMKDRMMH
jgi:hypothetical protein